MIAPNPEVQKTSISLVEASISDLQHALSSGALTAVELVSKYLQRIAVYDANGSCLNSVCVLNEQALEAAQASDDYRASGQPSRPLEGIPFTVKDSFKVQGMTVANGSPAFADLVATSDAVVVEALRGAGAIVLGRTNMPAMADGGAQRGIYGRAESPYSSEHLTTAFASGSSNGAGTSTAASFAAFGFGGETVSSGRAPSSTNGLVGYSPSRGVISPRGQWPLYATCDVVAPMTRTVSDLLDVLNVIVRDDESIHGNFWREQKAVIIPKASELRPRNYRDLENPSSLVGKRIGVPRMYIGKATAAYKISDSVLQLWQQAKSDLEAIGAEVIETDFPLVESYDKETYPGQSANVAGISKEWNDIERNEMIAIAWDDFLIQNNDPSFPDLTRANVTAEQIYPIAKPMDDPRFFTEAQNHIQYARILESARKRPKSILDLNKCTDSLQALEHARKTLFEDWLDAEDLDCLVFPTLGDVSRSDAEENYDSMQHALQDGVKYANGGRALKHLGIPAISVCMGISHDTKMPAGLTFIGKAYSDPDLLSYVFAFEQGSTSGRCAPGLTPEIPSDRIVIEGDDQNRPNHHQQTPQSKAPKITLTYSSIKQDTTTNHTENQTERQETTYQNFTIDLKGTITIPTDQEAKITISINGAEPTEIAPISNDGQWEYSSIVKKVVPYTKYPTMRRVPKDGNMVIVSAKCGGVGGRADALLLQL